METLKNKIALVFAASGEIAGAVARSFAQHGANVYVTGRDLTKVKGLADEINAAGGKAEATKRTRAQAWRSARGRSVRPSASFINPPAPAPMRSGNTSIFVSPAF